MLKKITKCLKYVRPFSNMHERIKICNLELASANTKKTILLIKFYPNKVLPFIRDWFGVFFIFLKKQ